MDIVLVDDEEDILRSVGGLLVDFGHEVIPARDGFEALKLLEEREGIGLVVSDIQMPGMDGIELLRSVRARRPGMPIILMTGYGDVDKTVAAFHYGAYDYVKKPIRLRDLLACIERVEEQGRLAAQLLRERQGLMQERAAGVGTILGGVACEIQAPAASAMGYLQSLEAFWKASRGYLSEVRPEDPSERKALDFILAEMPGLMSDVRARLERIADLVRDVGIFARAEGGGERRPVNLIGCLKEAVEMARSPLLGGAAFAESYDSEVIRVRANRQDLGRAFSHFLSNAVRAVQGREGPMVRIKAGIRDQGSGVGGAPIPNPRSPEAGRWAEVAVEDNGPGIPTEVRSRLFDPFFTTRPVGEGLGLGLPVCREIVREHGGEMGFESQAGEGARFWVRLPVVEGEG